MALTSFIAGIPAGTERLARVGTSRAWDLLSEPVMTRSKRVRFVDTQKMVQNRSTGPRRFCRHHQRHQSGGKGIAFWMNPRV
jgi:hypothetical protein